MRFPVCWTFLSSPLAGKRDIVVTILVRCMCVRPSGFFRTTTCKIMHGFQNSLGGGRVVLVKLPVPGRPTILITVWQGPTALAVGAGGGCLDIFTLTCPFFPLSSSL